MIRIAARTISMCFPPKTYLVVSCNSPLVVQHQTKYVRQNMDKKVKEAGAKTKEGIKKEPDFSDS